MIPLLIGVFLVIFFIVVLVLSASTWRGWHIAAACLTFLSMLGLIVVASLSQRTHVKWKEDFANFSEDLATEKAITVDVEIGDPKLVEPEEPSLLEVQQRMNELLLNRGRVWRRCMAVGPAQNNRITISTVPLNDDKTPGDPNMAEENGINTDMVLYAFRESTIPTADGSQAFVPVAYLGEFMVVNAQPTNVTLQPTLPLDGQQARLVDDVTASWALYEMMPMDTHEAFHEGSKAGELDNTVDQPVFGEVDEQKIREAFAASTGLPVDDPQIARLIAPYIKDGYAASETDVNALKANIWQKVEFQKDAEGDVVDSPDPIMGVEGDYFDKSGRAVAARLKRGEKTSFRNNDIGIFPYEYDTDKAWVDQRVSDGTLQKITPIFVRSLRDYEEAFHSIQNRFIARTQDIQRAERNNANLRTALTETREQTAYRQEERQKLKEDEAGFIRDNEKMDQLLAQLQEEEKKLNAKLGQLYRTNLALSEQLSIYSERLQEALEERAESVAVQ